MKEIVCLFTRNTQARVPDPLLQSDALAKCCQAMLLNLNSN